jgi:hypothetical protein
MVLSDQGVALGFDHLVAPLVEKEPLPRPVEQSWCWKRRAITSPTAKTRRTMAH